MSSTPKPKPSPASQSSIGTSKQKPLNTKGTIWRALFLFRSHAGGIFLDEIGAQTSREIISSCARAYAVKPRLGHRAHSAGCPESLGNARHAQGKRRNQRLRVSHLALPHRQGLPLPARQQTHAGRRRRSPGHGRAVPPPARYRKTSRHRPSRTPAHPQRRTLVPPLVRAAQLLHAQVDRRLGHAGKEPRGPRAPRRAGCRAAPGHHGSRTRAATHSQARVYPRSPRVYWLATHVTVPPPRPLAGHLLLPLPGRSRPPRRQTAGGRPHLRREKNEPAVLAAPGPSARPREIENKPHSLRPVNCRNSLPASGCSPKETRSASQLATRYMAMPLSSLG